MKSLTKKQKQFASLYAVTRNLREAATLMGLKNPMAQGLKLISNKQVKEEINRLTAEKIPTGEVATGLRRIAFGSVADAVKLILTQGEGLDIDSLDLYSVSEIKIAKGGGMEIKFFDRIKALEKLSGISGVEAAGVSPFVDAIRKGAENLNFSDEDIYGV